MDDTVTAADLLVAWRDATRAAELAERLALVAADAARQADARAVASAEIAGLAQQAAAAADRAADRARVAAAEAVTVAATLRGQEPSAERPISRADRPAPRSSPPRRDFAQDEVTDGNAPSSTPRAPHGGGPGA